MNRPLVQNDVRSRLAARSSRASNERITLFETRIFRTRLPAAEASALNPDIIAAALNYSREDAAGISWCEENAYPGYTSYGSLNDLPKRAPCFAALKKRLDAAVAAFVIDLAYDLRGGRLTLDSLWVNVLSPGGFHAGHIHPHSVISGTYYAATPKGSAALKFEDPRHAMMMVAPPRRDDAPEPLRPFVYFAPEPGAVLLWESFLRHEVPRNQSRKPRISVSFNYSWK